MGLALSRTGETTMTKLTKAEQARVDQIKGTKGPVPYKGDLLKAVCPDVEEAELARIDALLAKARFGQGE